MKYLCLFFSRRPRLTRVALARRSGFTLVEMLIVLAIIGILAAILFPAFASVRSNARATACASNLKQIGLGMLLYANDNSGQLPQVAVGIGSKSPRCGWPDLFFRYTRDAGVFTCPDDEEERVYNPACTATADAPTTDAVGSYNLVSKSSSLTRFEPTKIVLVVDGKGAWSKPGNTINGKDIVVPQDIINTLGEPRHSGGYNAVFGDGHAKRLSPDKMLDPVLWGRRR